MLVHEDNVKGSKWKMGKVLELVVGKDGVVRGVKLKVITKGKPIIVNRAMQKLYLLEVSSVVRVRVKVVSATQTRWEIPKGNKTRGGKSHGVRLRWILVGRHEPCFRITINLN